MDQAAFAWGKVLRDRIYGWNYETEPEPALDDRRVECARGKVIGGSSSINAMAYVRGHRADYDRWAASGLPRLVLCGRAALLPAAGKLGRRRGRVSRRRRAADRRDLALQDPLVDAYLEAGRDAGHPATADYNGARAARLRAACR